MSDKFWPSSDKDRLRSRRGGAVSSNGQTTLVYIEGTAYTYKQIMARLGVKETTVRSRIKLAREAGLALTWKTLGAKDA